MPNTQTLDQPINWLTLSQAGQYLGVHPTTLRQWVDSGKIPAFYTPGGHRRFAQRDLQEFLRQSQEVEQIQSLEGMIESTLSRSRERIAGQDWQSQPWHELFDEGAKQAHRQMGRDLLNLALQYVVENGDEDQIITAGRRLGRQYGHNCAQAGLSLAETTRAFLFFRDTVVSAANPTARRRRGNGRVKTHRRVRDFMNEVLLAVLGTYEAEVYGPQMSESA